MNLKRGGIGMRNFVILTVRRKEVTMEKVNNLIKTIIGSVLYRNLLLLLTVEIVVYLVLNSEIWEATQAIILKKGPEGDSGPRIMFRYLPSGMPQNWMYLEIVLIHGWLIFHNRILLRLLFSKPFLYLLALGSAITMLNIVWYWIEYSFALNPEEIQLSFSRKWAITIVGAIGYMSFSYVRDKVSILRLEALRKEVELNQLRTQLNPHFLFNSLNAIYGYILQGKEKSGELVLILSELMRHITDSSSKEYVPLKEEVDFICNYVAFEKERLGSRTEIELSHQLTEPSTEIPPLLLFPLIENAFKYGANSVSHTKIEINIHSDHQRIEVKTRNSIINQKTHSTKTGLSTTIRRLELLYPGRYKLLTHEDQSIFEVKLVINYE